MADDPVCQIQRNNEIADRLLKNNIHIDKDDRSYSGLMKAVESIRSCKEHRLIPGRGLQDLDAISPYYQKQVASCCLLVGNLFCCL